MSAGLFGLLDDIAALAKLAAASIDDLGAATGRATTKAVGVVVDDTAVTPQYASSSGSAPAGSAKFSPIWAGRARMRGNDKKF